MVKMPSFFSFFVVVLYPEQLENGRQVPSPVKQEHSEGFITLAIKKREKAYPI